LRSSQSIQGRLSTSPDLLPPLAFGLNPTSRGILGEPGKAAKSVGVNVGVFLALALTDREIRALGPRSRRYSVSDGGGLLLEVNQAGGKYWMWRHRFPPTQDGRHQELRLGPYPRLSLKAARQMRDEQKSFLREQGIDPCKAKKLARSERWTRQTGPTFAEVAEDWHHTKTAGTWSERHSEDVAKT